MLAAALLRSARRLRLGFERREHQRPPHRGRRSHADIADADRLDRPAPRRRRQEEGPDHHTTGGVSGGCSIPDAYGNFKYTGLDCTAAVAVATAWDQDGKDCNTVDNPNVDAGYHRTCSVEGFTCTAKRDIHSDGRFVTCTQGGRSIRFTWLPA